jgi:putative transposase
VQRYAVFYSDLEEIMAERGLNINHATLNRWIIKYSPLIANQMRKRKKPVAKSWRMPSQTFL